MAQGRTKRMVGILYICTAAKKGEILIRAYFPFESVMSTDDNDEENANALLDPSLNANAAALRARKARKDARDARQKARRQDVPVTTLLGVVVLFFSSDASDARA